MHLEMSVSMVLLNYQSFIEMTSNKIYIVALGGGFKCPCKIHLNTQCPPPPIPQFFRPSYGPSVKELSDLLMIPCECCLLLFFQWSFEDFVYY